MNKGILVAALLLSAQAAQAGKDQIKAIGSLDGYELYATWLMNKANLIRVRMALGTDLTGKVAAPQIANVGYVLSDEETIIEHLAEKNYKKVFAAIKDFKTILRSGADGLTQLNGEFQELLIAIGNKDKDIAKKLAYSNMYPSL